MNPEIENGGCVSPNMITCANGIEMSGGLSVRDYFAAAALQGLLAGGYRLPTHAAMDAYNHADAMLAARKEGGKP